MAFFSLLAFLNIAFPKEGASLPYIERVYVSGAASAGVTNVVVNGESVAVHPQGGWLTMVEVREGEVELVAEAKGERKVRRFKVAAKPRQGALGARSAPAEKVYTKLDYVLDMPKARATTRVVVIDPGHGGKDDGAVSPHNLPEKDANLRLAASVKRALESLGYTVYMTREDDTFIELYDRPKLIYEKDADIFVSIHHNAPPVDKDPREIRYHAVYAWNSLGEELAKCINEKMALGFGDQLINNGVPHANFAVTRNPETPSCLIEADFLTTPEAELEVWNPERREKIARAIAEGIDYYYRSYEL